MVRIIIVFSQSHPDFRIAEFQSICEMFSINVDTTAIPVMSHIFCTDFESIDDVRKILSRSVLIKYAIEGFYEVSSYEELYQEIRNKNLLEPYNNEKESFALRIFSIGRKKKLDNLERIRIFLDHVDLEKAPVDLKSPLNEFYLLEEYEKPEDAVPKSIFFGKLIGEGQSNLKTKYNLKERCYIGNTTMDPELSFIQANIAQIKPTNLVLDPFVGTGGLLLPAAEFGALVIGTEINYQTAKAIGKSSRQGVAERGENESIRANFEQYSTADRLAAIIIADSSKHGIWKKNPQFDVIVADPPYGVREKARKLGKKEKNIDEVTQETCENYVRYPEKQEYNLENTYCDLLDLAANTCVIGGRVSFWYPVILENYCQENLPKHPAMKLVSNCEQPLTRKSSRRLLTYKKLRNPENNEEKSEIAKSGVSDYRNQLFSRE